jgi:hypothetical protein
MSKNPLAVERVGMKRRRKKTSSPLTDEEMSRLSIKPRWWLERHEPIEITGHKLPFGIQAEATHKGIRYSGVLYPEKAIE